MDVIIDRDVLKSEWKKDSSEYLLEIHEELRNLGNRLNTSEGNFGIGDDAFIAYICEWLKLLEGIALLYREGLVDAAQPLTRTLFEVMLHLCYLIKDPLEIENKAACYFVVSEMQKYKLNNSLIKNKTKANLDTYEGSAKNDEIIKSLENSQIKSFSDVYSYIRNKKLIDADWNNISWYEVYITKHDNKGYNQYRKKNCELVHKSNRSLCKDVDFYNDLDKKVLMYDLIYALLSRQTHGFSSRDQIRDVNGLQVFRESDCLQNGLWQLDIINEMFKKIIRDISVIYSNFKYQDDQEFLVRCLGRKKQLDCLRGKLESLYKISY